jgi:hypothetical protein
LSASAGIKLKLTGGKKIIIGTLNAAIGEGTRALGRIETVPVGSGINEVFRCVVV